MLSYNTHWIYAAAFIMGNSTNRLAQFLGLRRNIALLLGAILLTGAGEELWMRFVPKYLEVLGAAPLLIGLYDGLKTALAALYAWPGGVLSDRWGHRRAFLLFSALSVAGYALLLALPNVAGVFLAMLLFLAWSNLSLPAMFSLVGAGLPPSKLVMGIGVQSLIKRVPIIVGPILGGVLLDTFGVTGGLRYGVLASVVLGAVSLLLESRIDEPPLSTPSGPRGFADAMRLLNPQLKRLLVSDILIRFCERIPAAWIVIYAMDHVNATATEVGLLTALETVTAMLCYIPVSSWADRRRKEPFVLVTFFFFTLFPLVLFFAHSLPMLALAFFIRGLKEFGDPSRKALIVSYAPAEARGRVIGAYYLVRDLSVSTGALVGAAAWKFGPEATFASAVIVGAAGTLFYWRWTSN